MTTEDDVYLKTFNQKKTGPKCSETEFERIMEAFEDTAAEQAPFASIDNTLIPFDTMQLALKQLQLPPKVQVFAKDIYEHWKARRQSSGNTPLQPSLKFEKNQELDDGDPYVCFRRRDARQTRKTRNRDVQSTEKLKRLRKELEDGRDLIRLALQRENTKRDLLKVEKDIFEQRCKLKETKVKLGIKADDDDLINQRVRALRNQPCMSPANLPSQPQKRKHSDFAQRPAGPQMRLPGRSDGRALDADLVQLSDLLAQKETLLLAEMEEQAEKHRKWNLNHVDLTKGPLPPVTGQETSFRPATAKYHYLMTPPSSVTSESFDNASPILDKPEPFSFNYRSFSPPEEEPRGQPAYRRRIGRGGRLWIDRKGMNSVAKGVENGTSDRWKYDQDDDDEPPTYELDPYDLKALKFRATIPFPPHLQQQQRAATGRATVTSPNNSRAIAAPQPQPQPPPAAAS